MQNRKLAVALGLLGATMLSAPAGAQTTAESTAPASAAADADQAVQAVTIETVIVTARRRAENLERVPVAVTAVLPETLRANTIRSALDLQQLSPSAGEEFADLIGHGTSLSGDMFRHPDARTVGKDFETFVARHYDERDAGDVGPRLTPDARANLPAHSFHVPLRHREPG